MTTASANVPIYLDYNATTPLHPEVVAAMRPFLEEGFGNPSSSHHFGSESARAIADARRSVARLINATPSEVLFTGGGSESNNLAIQGVSRSRHGGFASGHIVTSAIEHPAVAEVCSFLERLGTRVTRLPVDASGRVDPESVARAIEADTFLVSIMHANNEIGSIQRIREIAEIAHRRGILVHADAAQSVGKIRVDVRELDVDLLSVAAHKFYGPKGVGALFVRDGVAIRKIVFGADHEQNLRPGTENVLGIVGLGAAARVASGELDNSARHAREMRDLLWARINESGLPVVVNGDLDVALPNTLSVRFRGIEAATLLDALPGIAASAGAACHADSVEVSPVMEALGLPPHEAMGAVRLSTGRLLTSDDIERAAGQIVSTARRLVSVDHDVAVQSPDPGTEVRLTQFTHGLGCACKLPPRALEQVLAAVPTREDPRVITGFSTNDDAAVIALFDDRIMVQSVDFFTPVVDDPFDFGAIAAANALSDIYAMGCTPIVALNVVAFPAKRLPLDVLERILAGAASVTSEAGISIAGGHTIDDTEPKFGLVVTGEGRRDELFLNSTARGGDSLVLTKPIGTGIVTTAIKRDVAPTDVASGAIASMKATNKIAAELARSTGIRPAVTDVTGFGLLGHALELARASHVQVSIDPTLVPILPGARDLAAAGTVPGGTKNNLAFVGESVDWHRSVSQVDRILLCDAQTSGGLLLSMPEDSAPSFVKAALAAGVDAHVIGHVLDEDGAGSIVVTPS